MKSFLDACRLVEPLQLVVEAGGEPDVGVRVLHQPFALIGRDPRADVPLEHRLVSRRHAYLQVVEGFAFWMDLESRLGTQGGGRARKYGWLTRDEPMRIGPYELRLGGSGRPQVVEPAPPEVFPLASRSYGSTTWPDVGLEFLNGPSRSAVWPMNRVVSLVGSAAGCKFRLADPSVSQFHCSLVRTHAGVWVVDLLGGGVEVNNATVRYALLSDGDILAVGRYRIRIQSRSAPVGPPTDGRTLTLSRTPTPAGTELVAARRDADSEANLPAIPTVAVFPAQVEAAAGADPMAVLVPLMNQFGMMQQQMMDQFQNAMGMVVEMFGSLQREQMDLIRQELDQLRDVTREVQDLKAELASYARDRDAAAVADQAPPATASGPAAAPNPPTSPAADATAAVGRATDEAASAPAGSASRGPARPGAKPRPERPTTEAKDADVMLWLNHRISSLQQERETRWQKILKLLPGSS